MHSVGWSNYKLPEILFILFSLLLYLCSEIIRHTIKKNIQNIHTCIYLFSHIFSLIFLVYIYIVYVFLFTCAAMKVHVLVGVYASGGQRFILNIFLNSSSSFILRQVLSLKPESHDSASVAIQSNASIIWIFLRNSGITGNWLHSSGIYMSVGDQTLVLLPAQ